MALARGGDYADLFFEYRAGGGLVFDEGILKSASRGVSMGLGVRVQRGDATGYAYVEDLDWEAMKRAAETASQIASGGGGRAGGQAARRGGLEPLRAAVALHRHAGRGQTRAARASEPRRRTPSIRSIIKAEASFAEEVREIVLATSDGKVVHDVQPLFRFGVRAIAGEATASARRVRAAAAGA